MTQHRFIDTAPLGGTRRTSDGFLVTQARAVRTGIQIYTGAEVGLIDRDTVRVYRPEDEVRSPASLQSFSHAPVTMGHPAEAVTADNWKSLAIGEVSTAATWEGDHISLPLILKDATAIAAIEAGTRELSAGYVCQLDHTPGVTPQGEAYDAVQRGIVINHLAVVPRGRAGSTRIGDHDAATWGASPASTADTKGSPMADTLQTVVLGDQAAQVAVADAPKVEAFKAASAKALTDAETAHATAITAKDEEIGTLKADNKKLTDAAMTPEKVSKLVADRVALEGTAKAIFADAKTDGVSDADLRKSVVAHKLGDDMVADASEGEIVGMFKAIAKDAAKADPFADAKKNGTPPVDDGATGVETARKAMLDHLQNAHSAKKEA